MFRRLSLLFTAVAVSLTATGCATLFSSEHRTEDYTPLFASASAGDVSAVQAALAQDRSALMATEWDHATLLHLAVQQNHLELTQALINDGAEVNALTDDHLTPLHMAAQNGNVTISRLLLEHGAEINAVDGKGWTPLDRAEKWKHPLTATFLRASGGKKAVTTEPSDTVEIAEIIRHPTFVEALKFWLKLGFISFGGPAGQIAIMQTELVDRKKWISQSRFLHALNYCMLLPGPEAQQLAIYIGWLLHRTAGGIVAGSLFVIPSAFILWALSWVYAAYGNVPWIAAVFYGLKPAVMAIVASAVIRIGKKALKNEVMWGIAAFAFVAIFFFKLPFPLIILTAGLAGLIGGRYWEEKF